MLHPGDARLAGPRALGCAFAARRPGSVSVVFDERFSAAQVDAFVDALERFGIGYSWGGPMSLAVPYQRWLDARAAAPHRGTLVRLCDRAGGGRKT